ncbi:MAG TPA: hypothetical protein VE621_06320 [Bryobacteraceae bacterium]|jgi:YVTN family beta-propeller protein|nr:hypothetical protein [Bryobacteraceae bacterium]
MNRRVFLASSAGSALVGCKRQKAIGFPGFAFVTSEGSKRVVAVDLRRFVVKKPIELDAGPTEVLAHPKAERVYVLAPENGTVYEINTATLSLNRRLRVAPSATSMKLSWGGQALWVLSTLSRKLIRVSPEEMRVVGQFSIPPNSTDFDISPRKPHAAVSHAQDGAVTLFDVSQAAVSTVVRLGGWPSTVRFRSDGNVLLVANVKDRVLTSLQMPGGRVISSLPLAVRPDNLCFNLDSGQLFVTGEGADAAVVVYPYPFPEVAETVLAGSDPGPMAASEQYLFITNPRAGDVSIMDIATRKVIAIAPVGSDPRFVAVTPHSGFALVLNQKSGDMAVIRIGTIRAERNKRASVLTMIPVGERPTSATVRVSVA